MLKTETGDPCAAPRVRAPCPELRTDGRGSPGSERLSQGREPRSQQPALTAFARGRHLFAEAAFSQTSPWRGTPQGAATCTCALLLSRQGCPINDLRGAAALRLCEFYSFQVLIQYFCCQKFCCQARSGWCGHTPEHPMETGRGPRGTVDTAPLSQHVLSVTDGTLLVPQFHGPEGLGSDLSQGAWPREDRTLPTRCWLQPGPGRVCGVTGQAGQTWALRCSGQFAKPPSKTLSFASW